MLITVVVPRYVGVEEYGYWQLYLLYGAYVQIAQLGWSDGLLVRRAGDDFSLRSATWFTAQLLLQFLVVLGFALLLAIFSMTLASEDAQFIGMALAISVVVSNCRFMCLRLFQATRQMRLYSFNVTFDRVVYAALVFGLLALGVRNFEFLVIASLIARALALVLSLWSVRSFLTTHVKINQGDFREAASNISSGSRTLLAVLSGSLTIAVVRLIVESAWGVEAFSNVSLALNIAGLVSLFVSGLSFALLPYLRRLGSEQACRVYNPIRSLVSFVLVLTLCLYFPAKLIFAWWLPNYSLGLSLLFVLFPIIVFDGRTSLLTVTYLRSSRQETFLLVINVITLAITTVMAVLIAQITHDLTLTVAVTLIAVSARALALEHGMARRWALRVGTRPLLELLVVAAFLGLASWATGAWAVLGFVACVGAYALALRPDLRSALDTVKKVMLR